MGWQLALERQAPWNRSASFFLSGVHPPPPTALCSLQPEEGQPAGPGGWTGGTWGRGTGAGHPEGEATLVPSLLLCSKAGHLDPPMGQRRHEGAGMGCSVCLFGGFLSQGVCSLASQGLSHLLPTSPE